MSNRYITSHFPLISIVLFSLAFAMYSQTLILNELAKLGLYEGMREFFSENGIKLTLLFLLVLFFFMVFSALKLIADTIIELSMLFFSKDEEGNELNKAKAGSSIYLAASIIALLLSSELLLLIIVFLGASLIYFIYLVYKLTDAFHPAGLIGMIFFHMIFWSAFVVAVAYAGLKLYNSFIASLPL
ncbi:YufK family protein [Alkalihalobacillus oceani]|uniref:DUF5366 family protein n=1 Tax=Halalkalibacter oceani TaxID=1653776 RepID=UPI00203E6DDA|nr:DUF5366 family protein [Halalkalibacter oceani]MCM3762197.1 YufK family protein [Halalkalibacter oceani]